MFIGSYEPNRLSNIRFRLECQSVLHICKVVCCRFPFALSRQDVKEGIINWEFGRLYLIEVLYVVKHTYIKHRFSSAVYVPPKNPPFSHQNPWTNNVFSENVTQKYVPFMEH
nr:hypothetical protein [uncultured archaeon]